MRGFRLTVAADIGPDNPLEHDLYLGGGDLDTVAGDVATAQEIKTRLLFFKGESFTDTREGVPYFQEILRKGVDENRAKAIVRSTILNAPSIVDVPFVGFELDRSSRAATIAWRARTNTGRIISSEDFTPLIIGESRDGD